MLVNEVCLVAVKLIGNEDRNVVLPCVSRCCRQQNPIICLGDFEKCFCPGSIANHPLLVKYKEGVFNFRILSDVVPGIHNHSILVVVAVLMSREEERSQFPLPLTGIPFPGGGDDV